MSLETHYEGDLEQDAIETLEKLNAEDTRVSRLSIFSPELKEESLQHFQGIVPNECLAFVRSKARVERIQFAMLEQVHERICRRLPMGDPRAESARVSRRLDYMSAAPMAELV